MNLLSLIQTERDKLAGKAISHRPDLAGRVHLIQQIGTNEVVHQEIAEYADYAKVYQVYTWVHKAISRIAEAIAPLPVRAVDGDGEALDNHPLTTLFANGNDAMSPPDVWQRWVVHMLLGGESFFEIVPDSRGRPVELWPRRPDQVGVRPDKSEERTWYPRVAGYSLGDSADIIPPEAMWHSKFYNPLNIWRGLAPIAAVRQGIIIDLFAQAWSKAFLRRGARPDYAVIAPQGITQTEREEIETALMLKFQGEDGWHRPIVLEEGVTDIKTFSFAPKDIEWLEQRKLARDEVGGIFGVPDMIMGYGPETYDTEEKIRSALRLFWTLTITSLIQHRDISLTHYFSRIRAMLRPGERIATDVSGVGVLQEDLGPKIEQAGKLFGLSYPINAINERLGLDMPAVPWGNVGYLPAILLPAGSVPAATAGSQLAVVPALIKHVKRVEYGSAQHKALWDRYAASLIKHERTFQRQLKKDFQRQQGQVLRALRGEEGQAAAWAALIAEIRGEKQAEIPLNPDELLNWRVEVQFWQESYLAYFDRAVDEFGTGQMEQLGMDMAFDLRNPMVRQMVQQMLFKFADDINQTTQGRIGEVLRQILLEAEEEGLSIPDIQRRIYDRISQVYDVRKSDYETERIARTEMNKAANAGNVEGMRQSRVVEKKAWLAALDNRTRATHIEAHTRYNETPIGLDALFQVGRDQMLAPGGGSAPEEIINCRCTTIAIIEQNRP